MARTMVGIHHFLSLSIISSQEEIIIALFYRCRDLGSENWLSKLTEGPTFQPGLAGSLWSTSLHSTPLHQQRSWPFRNRRHRNLFVSFWEDSETAVVLRTIPAPFVSSAGKDMRNLGAGVMSLVTSEKEVLRTEDKTFYKRVKRIKRGK